MYAKSEFEMYLLHNDLKRLEKKAKRRASKEKI